MALHFNFVFCVLFVFQSPAVLACSPAVPVARACSRTVPQLFPANLACSPAVPAAQACSRTVPQFIKVSVRMETEQSGRESYSNTSHSSSNYNPNVAAAAEEQRERLLQMTSPARVQDGSLQETTPLLAALPARQLHFDPQLVQGGLAQPVPGQPQQNLQQPALTPSGMQLPPRRSSRTNIGVAPTRLGWETAAASSAAPGQPPTPTLSTTQASSLLPLSGVVPLSGVGRGRGQPHPLVRDTIRPGAVNHLLLQPGGAGGLGHGQHLLGGAAGQFASLNDQPGNLRERLLLAGDDGAGPGAGVDAGAAGDGRRGERQVNW